MSILESEGISINSIGTPSMEVSNSSIKSEKIPSADDILKLAKKNFNDSQGSPDVPSPDEVIDDVVSDFDTGEDEVIGEVPTQSAIFGEEEELVSNEDDIEEEEDDQDEYTRHSQSHYKASDITRLIDECKKSGRKRGGKK